MAWWEILIGVALIVTVATIIIRRRMRDESKDFSTFGSGGTSARSTGKDG